MRSDCLRFWFFFLSTSKSSFLLWSSPSLTLNMTRADSRAPLSCARTAGSEDVSLLLAIAHSHTQSLVHQHPASNALATATASPTPGNARAHTHSTHSLETTKDPRPRLTDKHGRARWAYEPNTTIKGRPTIVAPIHPSPSVERKTERKSESDDLARTGVETVTPSFLTLYL